MPSTRKVTLHSVCAAIGTIVCAVASSADDLLIGKELIVNGWAEAEPSVGWSTHDDLLSVTRSNAPLLGKTGEYFFRGPAGTVASSAPTVATIYQSIKVDGASAEIDGGSVAVGLHAMAGGLGSLNNSMQVHVNFRDHADGLIGEKQAEVSTSDRGRESMLMFLGIKECTVPAKTRSIEVTLVFNYRTGVSNDAAIDGVSLQLFTKGDVPFADDRNMVPFPSAESPAANCVWESTDLGVAVAFSGADGPTQYVATTPGRLTTVTKWIDVSTDAIGIDHTARQAMLSASVGGAGFADVSGEVTVQFCDETKKHIGTAPSLSTGTVSTSDRSGLAVVYPRSQGAAVPAHTRWVKLNLVFHNADSPDGSFAAIDNIDFRIRHTAELPVEPVPEPSESIFNRELLVNGNADEEASVGWQAPDGAAPAIARTSSELMGAIGESHFRGPTTGPSRVEVFQVVDVSGADADIDKGQVAAGLTISLGSEGLADGTATVTMTSYDGSNIVMATTEAKATPYDRGDTPRLLAREIATCALPVGARRIEVYVILEASGTDNVAAFDTASLRLLRTVPRPFELHANLAPAPSAETPAAPCAWGGKHLAVTPAIDDGGSGRFQYSSRTPGATVAEHWVDMSAEAAAVDAEEREAWVSASVGGSGTDEDSGEVTVTFFTAEKKQVGVAPALTTGTVAAKDRVYLAKLTRRSAFLLVPKTARLAKLEMKFDNTNATIFAAIDDVLFRITPARHNSVQPDASLPPGESIFDRQLLVNPNADQPISVGWVVADGAMPPVRSDEPLKGKQGVSFFRGPKAGADPRPDDDVDFTYAGMVQEVSVEAAASDIDAGEVSVGVSTLAGGVLSDSGDLYVDVAFIDADWEMLEAMEVIMVAYDRDSEALLLRVSEFRCVLDSGTRHLRVDVAFQDDEDPGENGAAADAFSLQIQKVLPHPFSVDSNLLPHPTVESVTSVCAYPHDEGELYVVSSYPGGDPPYQYSSFFPGDVTVVHWVDVSEDKAAIDLKQRIVTLAASIGGDGDEEDSGELRVTFCDAGKQPVSAEAPLTTGRVASAERDNRPLLLPRTAQAPVPQSTRWLKAELVFHNTDSTLGAGIDQLDLRVRHVADGSGAATSAFGRELVVNGEANEDVSVGWKTWDEEMTVVRSDAPLPGKDGQYFFRGPLGEDATDLAEMYQSVSLSEVAEEIKKGHVSAGLSVSAGSVASNEGYITATFDEYDAEDEEINSVYIYVYPSDRSHRALLLPHQAAICKLSAQASYLQVYLSFEYNNGDTNPAAIDSISMKLFENKHVEFAVSRNVFPMYSAEMPGSVCAWDSAKLAVTAAYTGASGRFQYSSVAGGETVVTQWVDVSSDQAGIDGSEGRIASLAARVGGAGVDDNSGRIDVTFCDHVKTPIGAAPALTTGAVTAAERGFLARLAPRAKPMKVPPSTRWLRVDLVFDNAPEATSAALDALDLRILRVGDHHNPPPGPEPSGSVFTRELLVNGHAEEEITTGWYTTDSEMEVIRSDDHVEGMDGTFYFRGPKGTNDAPATFDVSMEQEVDISEAGADIDAGLVAIGLQAMIGGTLDDAHEVEISAFTVDADGTDLDEVQISGEESTLVREVASECTISTGARSVRVLVMFSSFYEDNTAAADGIVLRLWKRSPVEFADNRNLIQFPSAESPFTLCAWQDEDMNIVVYPAYPGGDGAMQLESSDDGLTRAEKWIDLTLDAKAVDTLARIAALSARVGGGDMEDSGEVTVAFFDGRKVLIGDDPAMTTGKVTGEERGEEKRLVNRAVEAKVPIQSRWARVSLLFHNKPDGDWTAAIDMVGFRVRHTPHAVPSMIPDGPLEGRELLVNGDAEHPLSVGWVSDEEHMYFQRSESALDGKQGDHFFRGPSADHATTHSMYQRVDISAHASEIDGGGYSVGLTALLGSVHADDGDVTVSLYLRDEKLGELVFDTVFSDYEVRDEEAKLLPHQVRICKVPSGTRFLEVTVDMDNYGEESPGAVDGMSLRVSRIVAPFPFQQSGNLIPPSTADFPTAACQWGSTEVVAVPSYGGGVGLMHFASEMYGLSSVEAWVDLAGMDSSAPLQGSLSALVGGTTAAEVSGEVRVTFCDKDKAPVGVAPTMTTDVVTAAEREGLPGVRERSATLAVPTGAAWAQVELVFHNVFDSTSAAVDHITFTIHPRGESAAPVLPSTEPLVPIYARELLVNGDADEDVAVGWKTHDTSMGVIRSAAPLEAKQGEYFFRGPEGSIAHPAGAASMYQVVDIREAAADIAAGQVAAGLTAMVGGLHGADGVVTWTLEFSNADGDVLDDTLRSSGPSQRANEAKLVAEAAQLCKVPAGAVAVKVLITFAPLMLGDNPAAIDGMSLRLVRRGPVTFHDGINLAPAPSAEVPAAACLWTDGSQLVARQAFTGANGRFQYQALDSGRVEVPLRITVEQDAKPIDGHSRYVVLNARVGGSGAETSSGEVTLTFYDEDHKVIGASPAITTGLVDGTQRLGMGELLPRKAEAEIPANARSMLLSLVFHSSTTDAADQGAIDDIDLRVHRKPKVAPAPKPEGPLYNRNLLPNPGAEEPLPGGWDVTHVVRSDAPLDGKRGAFFFRGPQGTLDEAELDDVYMMHTIDVSSIAADIDAGSVALELSGMLGGVMGLEGGMSLLADWYNDDLDWIGESILEVRPADRRSTAQLIAQSKSDCKLPALLREIEVTAVFEYDSGSDNAAAIDDMALFLTKPADVPFALDTNLIPSPSAESAAATCHWEPHSEHMEVTPVYPGGDGRFQYQAKQPGTQLVTKWVDLSGDQPGIDSGARLASLDALIGGNAIVEDSGEVTVTFYGHDKVTALGAEPALTTGQVSPYERYFDERLVERHATTAVPHNARWAKVTLHFVNLDWLNGAAVDAIDFQLRETEPVGPPAPGPVAPLEPIFARELLLNGDADHPLSDLTASGWRASGGSSMEVVRSDEALEGKVGDFFFRGPTAETGAPKPASMYQSVDVSEATAEIDAGTAAVGFTGQIGGLEGMDGTVTVRLGFYEAGGVTLIAEKEKAVSNWDRKMLAALHPTELSECTVPSGTRVISLHLTFTHSMNSNTAAADHMSLRIVKKEPVKYALMADLVPAPSADTPAAACLWGSDALRVTAGFAGAHGRFQYQAVSNGNAVVTSWVDVSSDAAAIDAGERSLLVSGAIGGDGTGDDSGEVRATFCDEAKTPVASAVPVTTGRVTVLERLWSAQLVPKKMSGSFPKQTRWLRIDLLFHNADSFHGASLDSVVVHAMPTPKLPSPANGARVPSGEVIGTELLLNGDAEEDISVGWHALGGKPTRSDAAIAGKVGQHFFRGPVGTVASPADHTVTVQQRIDISAAASEIGAGGVAVGMSAMMGGLEDVGGTAEATLFLLDDKGAELEFLELLVSPGDRDELAMLVATQTAMCGVPPTTTVLELRLTLSAATDAVINAGAIDGVSLRLTQIKPVEFALDRNLVAMPSAEMPAAQCSWEGDDAMHVAAGYAGANGRFQYRAAIGGASAAVQWVRIDPAPVSETGGLAANSKRRATLSALIGGASTTADSGVASATFFDESKKAVGSGDPELTTGRVSSADRSGATKLLARTAEAELPAAARWAKIELSFLNVIGGSATAAVDLIDFRVLPAGAPVRPTGGSSSAVPAASSSAADGPQPATETPAKVPATASSDSPRADSSAAAGHTGAAGTVPGETVGAGYRAATQATGGIATVTGLLAGPAAAAQVGLAVGLGAAAMGCGRGSEAGNVAPLWPLSPLQLRLDTSAPGSYYRGAVIGNVILLAVSAAVVSGLVAVLRAVKFSTDAQPWSAAMSVVCFPSCLLVPAGLLAPGAAFGAVGALVDGGTGLDYFCAVLALLVVSGSLAPLVVFASRTRALLVSLEFVAAPPPAGLGCLLADGGVWSGAPEPSTQQHRTAGMAALLFRPYRGPLFLWWVPAQLVVSSAVAGAAGAAGSRCLGASVVIALCLTGQAAAAIAVRPHVCLMRSVLVAAASAAAAIGAVLFAIAAHRAGADNAALSGDGMLSSSSVLAIISIVLFLCDALVGGVKMVLRCRQQDSEQLGADMDRLQVLFGGEEAGDEITSSLGHEMIAKGPAPLAATTALELGVDGAAGAQAANSDSDVGLESKQSPAPPALRAEAARDADGEGLFSPDGLSLCGHLTIISTLSKSASNFAVYCCRVFV